MIRAATVTTLAVTLLFPAAPALAQAGLKTAPATATSPSPTTIRQSVAAYDFTPISHQMASLRRAEIQHNSVRRNSSIGNKFVGGVVGAVVGLFAGAAIGGWIEERRCQCGEPLEAMKFGGLAGATTGAIVGAWLF